MAKLQPLRRKRIPVRTCIACRQTSGKRELVRIVRTPSSGVVIDPTGKLAGRGAYLCRSRKCWESGLQGRKLGAALKTILSAEETAQLVAYAESLTEDET